MGRAPSGRSFGCGLSTVYRVQRFAEEGLKKVLRDRPQANRPRKLDDRGEAHLIALAQPSAEGHDHWTLRLLAGKVVELGLASSMSHEGIRKRLKKTLSAPWQKKEWCIPKVSAEFVANMEDVLDLYAEPHDPQRPVVCFDELHPVAGRDPAAAPAPAGTSAEYRREGQPLLGLEPLAGWRHVAVTQRRTMQDFARRMRWLVDEAYPEAEVVRVVLDNLNTHIAVRDFPG